jgi:hypothetical protein
MIEILTCKIQRPFLAQLLSASLLGLCFKHSREMVDESRMVRTQMGSTKDQKMVAVAWDALYDTTP